MDKVFLQKEKLNILSDFYNDSIEKVCFLKDKTNFLKNAIVEESLKNINEDFLIFNIKCFENTSLDDIFLCIFKEMKNYVQQKKLAFPKIETDSFALRMNQYLKQIKQPTIFIIDSLENIFDKKEEKEKNEIISFVKHLITLNKFKVVLISSYFTNEITKLENLSQLEINTIETTQLPLEDIKTIFDKENITTTDEILKQFYDLSKENPIQIKHAISIIHTTKISVENLINSFKYKSISFEEFLIQKLLTLIPTNTKASLQILSLFNGALPAEYLYQNNLFTKEQIEYLLDKDLLKKEYNLLSLRKSIKEFLQKTISQSEKTKIHRFWKDFYISQLPLKPNERIIQISRNTMRSQIEYHTANIINELPQDNKKKQNVSLLSYLNSNLTDWNLKTNTKEYSENNEADENKNKKRPTPPDSLKKEKKQNLEKYELTEKELGLLGVPIDLNDTKREQKQTNLSRTKEQRENIQKPVEKDLESLLLSADKEFSQHNYEIATTIYLKALIKESDPNYRKEKAKILSQLALCCKKMNKISEALGFYNALSEFYSEINDEAKIQQIKLEIAKLYKETYRLNHAKVIYNRFINQQETTCKEILIQSYIELADIEDNATNVEKATEYYKNAFALIDDEIKSNYPEIIANAYYKYALILDDARKPYEALKYYEYCIESAKESSIYLSSSYSNAAEILKEMFNHKKSYTYLKKALKTDLELENNEGIYYICQKLAHENPKPNHDETLKWLTKSLVAARNTKEKSYINNAYIELGDFYNSTKDYEKALKFYIKAQKNFEENNSSTNKGTNPLAKINQLKKLLDIKQYEKIYKEVNNNE